MPASRTWLESETVFSFLRLVATAHLIHRSHGTTHAAQLSLGSAWWPLPCASLGSAGQAGVMLYSRKLSTGQPGSAVIPMSNGGHWYAVGFCVEDKVAYNFDSMGLGLQVHVGTCLENFQQQHPDWAVVNLGLRLQTDGYQCGVWLAHFAACFFRYCDAAAAAAAVQLETHRTPSQLRVQHGAAPVRSLRTMCTGDHAAAAVAQWPPQQAPPTPCNTSPPWQHHTISNLPADRSLDRSHGCENSIYVSELRSWLMHGLACVVQDHSTSQQHLASGGQGGQGTSWTPAAPSQTARWLGVAPPVYEHFRKGHLDQ